MIAGDARPLVMNEFARWRAVNPPGTEEGGASDAPLGFYRHLRENAPDLLGPDASGWEMIRSWLRVAEWGEVSG